MNILVVDDNNAVLSQLNHSLKALSCHVTTAVNGLDGFEKAQNQAFDLIIIDHLMPLMDGIQLAKNLKNNTLLRHIPLIFMTTQDINSVQVHDIKSLFITVLEKPINETLLINAVKQLNLKNSRLVSL